MVLIGCLGALVGLAVGSFLNVVVYRVPRGDSVISPGSACPHCGEPISARDNIPVLGWLLLRGRARCCGAPISRRYPLVEAGTGVAFAAVALWLADREWWTALPAWWCFAAISIALALIDFDTHRLPEPITFPSYPVGLVLLAIATWGEGLPWSTLGRAVLAALALGLGYYGLYRLAKLLYGAGAFGFGDVMLAGILGLYLGWLGWDEVVVGTFLGFLVGGVLGTGLMLVKRAGRKTLIPFGPSMIIGAWLAVAWGGRLADLYRETAGL